MDPGKFKNEQVIGKSPEVIEINKQILHVRSELLRHYNLLKAQSTTVTPTMIKNAHLGIGTEKRPCCRLSIFIMRNLLKKLRKVNALKAR